MAKSVVEATNREFQKNPEIKRNSTIAGQISARSNLEIITTIKKDEFNSSVKTPIQTSENQ